MSLMSVTPETSQEDRSPSKDDAVRNMPPMSRTPDRSGTSVALYTMLRAPEKAFSILVHCVSPHWSIERSLDAEAPLSRLMRSKPPDM